MILEQLSGKDLRNLRLVLKGGDPVITSFLNFLHVYLSALTRDRETFLGVASKPHLATRV